MNLPNLISDIPNRTLPQYAIKTREFEDQIAERNSLDLELYRWVAENPRIELPELSNVPSPITVIVYETEKQVHSAGRAQMFSTDIVMKVLNGNPELETDLQQLAKLCHEKSIALGIS